MAMRGSSSCASLLAETASVIIPTVGPISTLAANVEFTHLHTLGRASAQFVVRLREGVLKDIHLDAVNGIICFPSLHAAVAVIGPFTLRWNKPLFCAVAVLDSVMFVSTRAQRQPLFCRRARRRRSRGSCHRASGPIQASLGA